METATRHTEGIHRFTIHNETKTIKIERWAKTGLVWKRCKWIEIYNAHIESLEMAHNFIKQIQHDQPA